MDEEGKGGRYVGGVEVEVEGEGEGEVDDSFLITGTAGSPSSSTHPTHDLLLPLLLFLLLQASLIVSLHCVCRLSQ